MGVPDPADIPPTPEQPAVSPRPVLVARCENFIEGADFDGALCVGRIHFRWGQSQAACDTCGGYCGIAVAAWERVEPDGAVPDTGQARETGADRAARPRRFTPEDALSVTERLGAAGPSGDTVQAPDVAALPPEVVAVIEAARAWAANNHRAGHTPTGPAARLDDAVCALLGTACALLGTDTTTEETP